MPSLRDRILRSRLYQVTLEGTVFRVVTWGYEKNLDRLSEYCDLTVELADRIERAAERRALQDYPSVP